VTQDATDRFTNRADDYARYRPGYPSALIDFLRSDCGLDCNSVVADIGSGSGQLARLFLGLTKTVFAVEPNRAMRRMAEESFAAQAELVSVAGMAEATQLPADSVDFVTAGQAFHWFDAVKFAAEARRIMRGRGQGVLVWNVRCEGRNHFVRDYKRLLMRHCEERHLITEQRDDPTRLAVFYGGSAYACRSFEYRQSLDFPGLVGRVCSSSYAPRPGQSAYEPMVADLRSLFDRYNDDGNVTIEYETRVYFGGLG
jgi:SAM-dependent methyltransferase